MNANKEEIRCILKVHYQEGKTARQATKEICNQYGENALSLRTAKRWFARFRAGNLDIKDSERTGRPTTGKVNEIIKKVQENETISSYEVAKELNICQQTVLNQLKKAGFKRKLGVWVEPQPEVVKVDPQADTKEA